MSKIVSALKSLKDKTKSSILRFPASILCLFIIYVLTDVRRYTHIQPNDKLFLILSYGVLVAFIVDILLENLKQTNIRFRLICYFLTYVILQVSYFFVNTKIGPNLCVFTCLTSLAIFVLYNKERGNFEANLAKILTGEFVAGFFSSILLAGLLLIIWSIDVLLIEISGDLYTECMQLVSLIVFPVLFLAEIPKMGQNVEYPHIMRKLLRFVVLPLLMVFTVVLYVYYGKLIVTRQLPIEEMMFIAMLFLSVAVSTLILITPFEEKLPKYTRKWGVFLLIPVVLVLIFAAICNIRDIGLTYVGYMALVGAIVTIIQIIFTKLKDAKYQYNIFLVIAIFSLICGFGPINMFKLTTISQQNILTATLNKNGMLKDNKIVPNDSVSKQDRKKILDAYRYLERNDLDLPSYCVNKYKYMTAERIFGFTNDYYVERFSCKDKLIDISGYQYFTQETFGLNPIKTDKGLLKINLDRDLDGKWTIYLDDEVLFEMKYEDICNAVYSNVKKLNREECTQQEMSYIYNSDKINVKVVYNFLDYEDGKCEYGSYMLLVNLPDNEVLYEVLD